MYQQQPYSQQQQQPYSQQPPQMHHNTTTVVTSTGMQPAVVMATTPPTTLKVNTIKGLSITQIVIGVVTLGLGIGVITGADNYWISNVSGGIWGGIWIIITGILGVCVSVNPNNSCLVGTTMAFNIIATIIAFIDGILFLIAVVYTAGCSNYNYYNYYDNYYNEYNYNYYYSSCYAYASSASAMFGILMTASGIEFFLALITSIYCCKCCGTATTGVIVQQAQPQYLVTSTAAGGYMPPQSAYNSQGMQYSANYPPQYQPQPHMAQAQAPGANTNVAYSMNLPEKQNLVHAEAPMGGYHGPDSQAPPPYSQN